MNKTKINIRKDQKSLRDFFLSKRNPAIDKQQQSNANPSEEENNTGERRYFKSFMMGRFLLDPLYLEIMLGKY